MTEMAADAANSDQPRQPKRQMLGGRAAGRDDLGKGTGMADEPGPEQIPVSAGSADLSAAGVARWRRAQRAELLEARTRLSLPLRGQIADALGLHLDHLLEARGLLRPGSVISGYWPIRSEPDLRPWMLRLAARGLRLALPVVETRAAPLAFRPWSAGARMERGFWNILVPATSEHVLPDIALAPLVGWDAAGYRLGYGGGYFDRTLAALRPKPFVIGVGFQAAQLATIHPQSHDIRPDAIITETGLQAG